MPPPPADAGHADSEGEDGWIARVRSNVLLSTVALLVGWLVLGFVVFVILALTTQSVAIAFVGGLLGGLAASGAVGYKLGFAQRVDHARRGAPLWVRLLIPLPLLLFLLLLLVVLVAPLFTSFVLSILVVGLLAFLGTAAAVYFLGLWDDVPGKVRSTRPTGRLLSVFGVAILAGILGFFIGLLLLEEAYTALAIFLPAALAGGFLFAILTRWHRDVREGLRTLPIWARLAGFVVLWVLLTYYFALLLGPLVDIAVAVYAISAVAALALLVPLTVWAHTWRDLWARFVALGEGNRVLTVLPILPIAAALVFLLIVVLTSNFEVAYVASIPAGIAAFLAAGLAFGVTQEIAPVVRKQPLPRRIGIFLAAFLLLTLYAYFAVALFTQAVELSLIAGLVFAAIVVGLSIKLLNLGEGLGDEFESYGPRGEALVLGLVFFGALALSFILLALATGSFRIAFLVSVLVAAAANYIIAHTTKLVVGLREALEAIPWWAELGVLTVLFLGAFLYGAIAVGQFIASVPLALAVGAALGLTSVVLVAWDLKIGEDVLTTADERKRAKTVLILLAFLGGFLLGLYAAAGAMSLAGSDLFGVPFFIALGTGFGAAFWLARSRNWHDAVLGRMRTTRDRAKVLTILAIWLVLGSLTGLVLQSVPIDASAIGLGEAGVPLSLTLALGLLLWLFLPAVLFRAIGVERTPVQATLTMGEKPRFLASLGWGLLAGVVTLVLLTSLVDSPLVSFGSAIVIGYVVALVVTIVRTRRLAAVRDPRGAGAGDAPPARPPQ